MTEPTTTAPTFTGGTNIAMKVPSHEWEATVGFYRDVLGLTALDPVDTDPPSVRFALGPVQLWIDRVDGLSQAELWLEVGTDDVAGAARHLDAAGVVRRDEIEPLPDEVDGFWIANPASIIHLVQRGSPAAA